MVRTKKPSKDSLQKPKRSKAVVHPTLTDVVGYGGVVASSGSVDTNSNVKQDPKLDESLFKAFQSNLLSLISHELRTPLMGILNALTLLEEGGEMAGDFSQAELVAMARRNAQRLHRTLAALLDLASLESGNFHVKLREVQLLRLLQGRLAVNQSVLKDRLLQLQAELDENKAAATAVLADPQRLGRAIDLCLQTIVARAEQGSTLTVDGDHGFIELGFTLATGGESLWDTAWSEALVGFEGGVLSPSSAFSGVMQSEQAFLSRMEEGLGSELILVHEIMRLHRGSFASARMGRAVRLRITLPELSDRDGITAVLSSRTAQLASEGGGIGSIAAALIEVPKNLELERARMQVKKALFRSTDAVYVLSDLRSLALVMDDCKPEDAARLVARVMTQAGFSGRVGVVTAPHDGLEANLLLELAEQRLKHSP